MRHADLYYLPYYGNRPEDQEKISEIVGLINAFMQKAVPSTNQQSPFDAFGGFFNYYDLYVSLKDGQYFSFEMDGEKIHFYHDGVFYTAEDPTIQREIYQYRVDTQHMTLSKSEVSVGESVRITGNGALPENGGVRIFLNPHSYSGNVQSTERDITFSTKDTLLIYEGQIVKYGRYDFELTIPAYGRDYTNKQVWIEPGKWTIELDFGGVRFFGSLTIFPAEAPLLTVNGIPIETNLSNQPRLINGRFMMPIRAVTEALGWQVIWDAKFRQVLLYNDGSDHTERLEKSTGEGIQLWVNGERLEADVPPVLISGTVFVPISIVSNALHYPVMWLEQLNTVNLSVTPDPLRMGAPGTNEDRISDVMNQYVTFYNGRYEKKLLELFVTDADTLPQFDQIGHHRIVDLDERSITVQDGSANVTLHLSSMFHPKGIIHSELKVELIQQEGEWKIASIAEAEESG
ncbi:hypothetical protein XYCOK13_00750 [Xylanibacillus composti]|uniref:Copper amine oxidase-like N-terminal domain-containing protein n=2 Tax=Xylanibacillus composti TaxID=1572762 RepID=A0A8J4M175_9BACL|nr:hypothetical protein XYCOK13_00750 [Xylanibacillus composti]